MVIVLAMKFPHEICVTRRHGKEKAKYRNQMKLLERVEVRVCIDLYIPLVLF